MKSKNSRQIRSNEENGIIPFIKHNKKAIKIGVIVGLFLFPLTMLQFICQIPVESLIQRSPQYVSLIKSYFATLPTIEIKRSTFNNMFTLTKSSAQKDSIIVSGVNTTHRLIVKVTNTSDEELRIKNFNVYDQGKGKLVFNLQYKAEGEQVLSSESKEFVVESPSLFGKDSLTRVIESGDLVLVTQTNFGSVATPINCICFFNGQTFSNGKHLYSIGKDSSCIKFEYNDPEGAKAQGLIPANEYY